MAGEKASDWLIGDQSKGSGGGEREVTAASLTWGGHGGGGGGEVNAKSLLIGGTGGGGGKESGRRMSAADLTVGKRKSGKEKPPGAFFDGLFTKPADEIGKKEPKSRSVPRPDPTPSEPRRTIRQRISDRFTTTDFTPVGDPRAFDQDRTGLRSRHRAVQNLVTNRQDGGRLVSPAIREARSQGRLPDQRDANQSPIDDTPPRRLFGRSGAVVTGLALLRMAAGSEQTGDGGQFSAGATESSFGSSIVGVAETSNPRRVAEPPRELGALTITAVRIEMPPRDLAA